MKLFVHIGIVLLFCYSARAQENSKADFTWGNVSFYNLNKGESIEYNSSVIKLLSQYNRHNTFSIGKDTLCIKVSNRSLPLSSNHIQLYVLDNKNVKALSSNKKEHGLLTKDVLIGVYDFKNKMLNPNQFTFPVSFNDGFLWTAEEDASMFSYKEKTNDIRCKRGIGIDLHDARGIEKHWIVALENTSVVWVEDKDIGAMGKEASVLLQSHSNPQIYYLYNHLYNKSLEVRKGQKLIRGELVGTVWGDDNWGHLQLLVIKSDTVPTFLNRYHNSLGCFPQLYELYQHDMFSLPKTFTKGKIEFGRSYLYNRNQKNNASFEEYLGKGWLFQKWNKVEKHESVAIGEEGNVRLRKVMFSGEKAQSTNPRNYFEYEVNVPNGVYRIRAKVGDLLQPSWQKVNFEGVTAAEYSLEAGEQKWTAERAIKVRDRKITVRIYVDGENKKVAGLSEIVFQQAY